MKAKTEKKNSLILKLIKFKLDFLDFISPLALVGLRLYIANIFFKSGLTKIANFDNAILLFKDEYMTADKITLFGYKFLTPEIAAYAGTAAELGFSILLVLGLASRFAAFGLLVMTAVIEFTYASYPEHQVWALMLFTILTIGGGKASWDYFIKNTFFGSAESDTIKQKLFAVFCTLCLSLYATYLIFVNIIQMH